MQRRTTFAPEQKRFECRDCPHTPVANTYQPTCPKCGGDMRNTARR